MFEKERFMFKQILVSIVAVATTAMVSPASSQRFSPTSEQAKRIEAMVNKAAALVERQGKEAFQSLESAIASGGSVTPMYSRTIKTSMCC